jgi:hypothetical protein
VCIAKAQQQTFCRSYLLLDSSYIPVEKMTYYHRHILEILAFVGVVRGHRRDSPTNFLPVTILHYPVCALCAISL